MITLEEIKRRRIYSMYLEEFGDRKPSELGVKELKEVYRCPQCIGTGSLHQYTSDGKNEYDYTCNVCSGLGYTERKLRPKMDQSGWE